MTPDICFLIFAYIRHVYQNLAHVRDYAQQFYGNYRTLHNVF